MRLDLYISNSYGYTRSRAQDLIKLGSVRVNNEIIKKPAYNVKEEDSINVSDDLKYVSRAGEKLEDAIKAFNLDFKDKTVMDIGSSTGGFTQCSLLFGAKHVYAYDVGSFQMDVSLRNNPQISLFEQTNILSVDKHEVDIILIDVSFTSIKPILKHVLGWANYYVLLFKPQFEATPSLVKNGVIKSDKLLKRLVDEFNVFLEDENIKVIGYKKSDLKGKKGNQEFLFIGEYVK